MPHNEDFLYYGSNSSFLEDLNNGEILNTSIAFIADKGIIYNRGHYFGKQTLPDSDFNESSENSLLNKTITGAINLINLSLGLMSESINDINDNILELDTDKADLEKVYTKTQIDQLLIPYIGEAPSDGKSYVRRNNTWVLEGEYEHPTGSGYKHIPAGGSEGQILIWSEEGTAAWGNTPSYDVATTASNGLMSAEDKIKLENLDDAIQELELSITNISDDITNLLELVNNVVSFPEAPNDESKYVRKSESWEKLNNASSSVDGLMSKEDKSRLDTLYNLIDADNPSDGIINKYNEIVSFLDGISSEGNTLQEIIDTIPTENATSNSDGLMSKEDKTKLDNLDTTVSNIVSFPEAPDDGNKYVRKNKSWVQETSYSAVTTSVNGLMISTDKAWFDNFKNYNTGSNTGANITAITNTKKLSVCSVTANATLGLSAAIPTDYANELHVLVHNTGSSAVTITIPSTLASKTTVNMMGENLQISAGKWGEINILTDGNTYYVRHEAI